MQDRLLADKDELGRKCEKLESALKVRRWSLLAVL
jgi:hypothetical protein